MVGQLQHVTAHRVLLAPTNAKTGVGETGYAYWYEDRPFYLEDVARNPPFAIKADIEKATA